jgi:elongation factor P--beta-lysine ligase
MRILCEFAQVERGEKMNTKTKYEVYIEGDWLTNYRDEKVETVEQAKRHAEFKTNRLRIHVQSKWIRF